MAREASKYQIVGIGVQNGCTSACLDMVLRRYGFVVPQKDIAEAIGVPYFPPKQGEESRINKFLRQRGFPFTEEYTHWNEVLDHDFGFFIKGCLKDSRDAMVVYNGPNPEEIGHTVLIYDINEPTILVLDPGKGPARFDLGQLAETNAGFCVLSRKS